MQITLDPHVEAEFKYMLDLLEIDGNSPFDGVESLVAYILSSIADGSRRPGSWERGMLRQMGLVADCDAHHVYRATYGEPK